MRALQAARESRSLHSARFAPVGMTMRLLARNNICSSSSAPGHWQLRGAIQSCVAAQQCPRDDRPGRPLGLYLRRSALPIRERRAWSSGCIDQAPLPQFLKDEWGKCLPGAGNSSAHDIHREIERIHQICDADSQGPSHSAEDFPGLFVSLNRQVVNRLGVEFRI